MADNKKIPEIRFAGFTDPWEQRKVAEMFKITRGYVLAAPLTDENPSDAKPYPVYSSQTKDNGLMGYYKDYLYEDAITWTTDGANAGTVNYRSGKFYCTNVCGVLLADKVTPNQMIAEALNNVAKGHVSYVGNPKLMNNVMAEITISLPTSEKEREAISAFFDQIDNLITLHQRKYDRLKNVKKSMLEKMFPRDGHDVPEIRFAGFTDAWEQRKWSNTVDISTDMVDPKTGLYDELPHVAPGNIESFTGRLFDNVKLVKDENLISGKFRFSAGDIIYGKINPQLGKYVFAAFSGLTSADAYVLNAKNGIDQKFLYAVLQTKDFFDYSVSVSKRSGMPKINRDELNAYSFAAPSTAEQAKIGSFLLGIDNLITLHQRKYEKLKQIKKSMLEKMFV